MTTPAGLLLLDLDGVVVFEAPAARGGAREILLLHPELGRLLAASGLPTIILTHRSRREAKQILRAAGLDLSALMHLIAAEDLFFEALRGLKLRQMLGGGLQKSLALDLAERASGISRTRMAIIDDRDHNIMALAAGGVGLTVKAPSDLSADDAALTTFSMPDALTVIGGWMNGSGGPRAIELSPEIYSIEGWRRSGLSTEKLEKHFFNHFRRVSFRLRQLFVSKPERR